MDVGLVYHADYLKHDPGMHHPERAGRLEAIMMPSKRVAGPDNSSSSPGTTTLETGLPKCISLSCYNWSSSPASVPPRRLILIRSSAAIRSTLP